ncbi:MAG: glucose-1-phosphate cytidylyltransferase [Candidatus Omnitrophota bacterium]
MKVMILAGGLGTRLSEETVAKPKPMIEIGGKPMIWHIMNIYSSYGFNEFVVALGYKGEVVKEYFLNYNLHHSDLTIDLKTGKADVKNGGHKDWKIHLIDTGANTMTGGRIARLRAIAGKDAFMLTYGDGVADIDIKKLAKFHKSHGKIATVTAVRPIARFGGMEFDSKDRVTKFKEKTQTAEGWINGGFFVFEPEIFDYLGKDDSILERDPLERLARDGELMAYKHEGFWQCMDTVRDRQLLEELWQTGKAPWKR